MPSRVHCIEVDLTRPLHEQAGKGHNRWHPDIPPVLHVDPGDTIVLQTKDALDGQITMDSTHETMGKLEPRSHALTGPVYVNGAEPGDLLEVKVLDIEPDNFAWTGVIPGAGFLRDTFKDPYLVRWRLHGGYAESPDVPGVRVPGHPFMGVMGTAPSRDLLLEWNRREQELLDRGLRGSRPEPSFAHPRVSDVPEIGARTGPPRENGGNVDIKNLTKGATILYPVFVPGALFSAGDAHFAQGDGEVCISAIEMAATLHAQCYLRKGEAARRNVRDIEYSHGDYFMAPEHAVPRRYYATTGMCVNRDGSVGSEDITMAAKNALMNMIDHLVGRGYTPEQAYVICSVAVDLRISEVVDLPNVVVSAVLPLDIFL